MRDRQRQAATGSDDARQAAMAATRLSMSVQSVEQLRLVMCEYC